jgi:hypothetical protein
VKRLKLSQSLCRGSACSMLAISSLSPEGWLQVGQGRGRAGQRGGGGARAGRACRRG